MTTIETAATSYASSFKNHLSTADQERLKEAFTKGFKWAVADPDVLRDILKPFAEWLSLKGFYQDIDLKWRYKFLGEIRIYAETTEELISKYLQHLQTIKQKEDGK